MPATRRATTRHDDTSGSFQCTFPDGPATSQVTVQATDEDGAPGNTAMQSVTVNNVAPAVTAAANRPSSEGQRAYMFNLGSFSDPGTDSPWTVTVMWGDGSPATTFTTTSTGSLGRSRTLPGRSERLHGDGCRERRRRTGCGTPPSRYTSITSLRRSRSDRSGDGERGRHEDLHVLDLRSGSGHGPVGHHELWSQRHEEQRVEHQHLGHLRLHVPRWAGDSDGHCSGDRLGHCLREHRRARA